jgi:outer membrane protein
MKNKKLLILSTLLVLFASLGSIFAEIKKISMDEAIKMAVSNSFDSKVALKNVMKADAAVDEAFGNALPSVNLSGNYTRNLKVPVFFLPNFQNPQSTELIPVEIGAKNSFQSVASVTQILFNSTVFTAINNSRVYSDGAREQFKSTISRTINNAKKAYLGALLAKEYVSTSKSSFETAQENLKNVEIYFKEGFIPEFDLIRAKVGVENIRPMLLQAQSGYTAALNGLKVTLGLNINDSIEVVGNLAMTEDAEIADETKMIDEALKSNYDLASLKYSSIFMNKMIDLRESENYPMVYLNGNYVYQGQSNDFNFVTAASASVALGVQFNLFQGFQTNARVQQAKVDYQSMEIRLQQMTEVIKMQIKNSVNQIKVAKERFDAQKQNVELAERGYEIAKIRYKEGAGNQMELNDADLSLYQARLNRAQSIHDYLSAKADLENLLSKEDPKYFDIIKYK